MNFKKLATAIVFSFVGFSAFSQSQASEEQNTFELKNPDYTISPTTGMTRQHWIDAALYLLKGAFTYIDDLDDPMKFPKQPGKSYPHDERQVPTEKLEGLCRTLFIAAPLLKENPDLTINNINVGEYYRYQIRQLINPESPSYIVHRPKDGGPSQNLVEYGALAISLFVVPEVIWQPLSQEDKDALAASMLSYGDGPTVDSNWKFFNIFVLSFFKDQGYDVNDELLEKYLTRSLTHYRSDGWYNDSPAYDYYSMWAFQLYGVVWSEVFGNKHYPEYADKFLANFKDLYNSYPYMFSKEGKMLMYGRSISYRMGSIAPFPFMGKYGNDNVNLGWLRMISSTTMLQFLQHPDFLKNNVPTLGFYGPFEPAVQNYSCRGSVFWMGKAFLSLLLPADNPFWTAKENNGVWNEYDNNKVYNYYASSPELLITDYPQSGASEIRAWCHEKVKDDWQKFRSTENYNRLSYSSIFPWQADGENGEVAMNYAFLNANKQWEVFRLYTFQKFEDGAYYRNAVLETDNEIKMNLVDIPLPNGILRVDRNITNKDVEMRIGHYALPQFDSEITLSTQKAGKYEATIIDNGKYQQAFVPIAGWDKVEVVNTTGLHPESDKSAVINASHFYKANNTPEYSISLMLWKESGQKWKTKDLNPIKSIEFINQKNTIILHFQNKEVKTIQFD
nr:DUF2264 domain-containing protein [uncultured Carboxylicivirga sp.]